MKEKFYHLWWWLEENHEWALTNLSIEVVKVNPLTKEIDDNKEKNTEINFWLETGSFERHPEFGMTRTHDIRLNCGAETFEEAIIKLAGLVRQRFGDKSDIYGNKAQEL